jgi:hypothetical protein
MAPVPGWPNYSPRHRVQSHRAGILNRALTKLLRSSILTLTNMYGKLGYEIDARALQYVHLGHDYNPNSQAFRLVT